MLNTGRDFGVSFSQDVRIEIAILADAKRRAARPDLMRLRDVVVVGRQPTTPAAQALPAALIVQSNQFRFSLPAPGE